MSTGIDECSLTRCEACGEVAVHPLTAICGECGKEVADDVAAVLDCQQADALPTD